MAQKTLFSEMNVGGPATTASTVEYWTPGAGVAASTTTEANAQVKLRTPGTMANFYVRIGSNTGTHVFRTRKNTANGNMTVTVNATGVFEDNTNTDTIAAADLFCYTTDSAANTTTWWVISNHFTATTDTGSICVAWIQTTQTTASTTWYIPLTARYNTNTTTETNMKSRMRKAGTLKFLGCHVQTNRATNTTIRLRKNGANGNQLLTITGGAGAAFYEDTTNTDTVSAGEDWNYSETTGTGADTLQLNNIKCEFISTNGDGVSISGDPAGSAVTDNSTGFFGIGGRCVTTATENAQKVKAKSAFDISNVGCVCSQNDVSSASTFKLRKNGADVTNTVSVTGNTPGVYVDTTHTDTVADGDELNQALVVPSVSGTHTVTLTQTFLSTHLAVTNDYTTSLATETVTISDTSQPTRMLAAKRNPQETISTSDSLGRTYNAIRKPSTSLSFDGNEDRANLGNHAGLWSQALSKFSFAVWVYAKTISNSSFRSVFIHAPAGFENAVDCYITSGGILRFDMNDTGAVNLSAAQNTAFNTTNKWYHIVGTYDNSLAQNARIQLYVDNVVGTSSDTGAIAPNGSADMLLGDDDQSGSVSTSWDGYIKDFRWFNNKVLNSTERTDIRNNSSSAPTPDYWLPMHEGTGTPVDVIGGKTTSFVNNTTWGSGGEPFSDFIKVSDSLISVKGQSRSLSTETVTISEVSLNRMLAATRSFPETTSIGETLLRMLSANRPLSTETVTVSENLQRTRGAVAVLATQTVTVGETLNRMLAATRSLPETTSSGESISRMLGASRTLPETTAVSDNLTRLLSANRALSTEVTAISDSLNRLVASTRSLPENTAVSDSLTKMLAASRTLATETVTINETLQRMLAARRTLQDTTSIIEDLDTEFTSGGGGAQNYNRSITEDTSISESLERMLAATRILNTETTSISDDLNRMLAANRAIASESTPIGEILQRLLAAFRTSQDTITTDDSINRTYSASRPIQEDVSILDSLSLRLAAFRTLVENVGITDLLEYLKHSIGNQDYIVNLIENVLITDNIRTWLSPLKIFKSLKGNFRSEGVRTESQGRRIRPANWFRSSFYTNERTRNPKRNSESEGQ